MDNKFSALLLNTFSMPYIYYKEHDNSLGEATVNFEDGVTAIQKGNIAEAVNCFALGLKKNPESPLFITNLAVICISSFNDFNEAYRLFEMGVNKNPKNPQLHYNFGTFLYSLRNFKEAKNQLIQADSLLSKNISILNNLGLCCLAMNELNEARKYFTEAIEIDSTFVYGYHNLAHTYYNEKNYETAIINFEKALELVNDSSAILNDLGCSYYCNGNTKKSLDLLKKSINVIEDVVKTKNNNIFPQDFSYRIPYCNYGFIKQKESHQE